MRIARERILLHEKLIKGIKDVTSLVAALVVIADEGAVIDVNSHFDALVALGQPLRVHIVPDSHRPFLNQVHVLHIVLFVVNGGERIRRACVKQER